MVLATSFLVMVQVGKDHDFEYSVGLKSRMLSPKVSITTSDKYLYLSHFNNREKNTFDQLL